MRLFDGAAIVTGAAGGIGQAVAEALGRRGCKMLGLVDRSERVLNEAARLRAMGYYATGFVGDTTNEAFRSKVFSVLENAGHPVRILVPAAGITRDALAVKLDKEAGEARLYPPVHFEEVLRINLTSPTYWALEMIGRTAARRHQAALGKWSFTEEIEATVVFIGSVSSQGNKGQIAYAASKKALEAVAATLRQEGIYHGVRASVVHPGFTETPMTGAMPQEALSHALLQTQLRRMIQPAEIASVVLAAIENPILSGELWADAGYHPNAA